MPRLACGLATRTHRVRPSEKTALRTVPWFAPGRPCTDPLAISRRGGLRTPARKKLARPTHAISGHRYLAYLSHLPPRLDLDRVEGRRGRPLECASWSRAFSKAHRDLAEKGSSDSSEKTRWKVGGSAHLSPVPFAPSGSSPEGEGRDGGGGRIRTHGPPHRGATVFKTAALNHSATFP